MAIMQDILLGSDGDLLIEGGDLTAGDSTLQHQGLLLLCNKGELKQNPMRGVGVNGYVESTDDGLLAREIHSEFSLDGMKIEQIKVDIPNIQIEAAYED